MQHDNKVTRNVADTALKIMMGEEPDNQQFTKEVDKAKKKATEKKSPEDEARVAAPKVDASVTVPESGVTVKEELKGGQKNIDMNKNGKIDAEDFKMLRKKKSAKRTVTIDKPDRLVSMKVSKEEVESLEEGKLKDMVTKHMDDGHSFDTAMKKAQADLNKMAVKKASDEHPEAKFRTNPLKPVMSKSDREASKKNLGKLLNKSMKKEETELEEGKHESKALAAAFKKLKGKSTMSNKSSTGGTITRPAPGVIRHKAKLASGADYGDSSKDTRAGGIEDSDAEGPAKFKRTYKRKSYGARQNYDRGTRVSGKDVNESFGFSAMLESYKEKGLDYIREMNEDIELLDEKNKPTNPALWSRAKAAAKAKFDVYPSAYANGWAAKWYKKRGGGWKSVSEEVELTEAYKLTKTYNDKDSAEHDVHHKGKHVGYIVHDKKTGQHIAYHSPENGEFNQSDVTDSHKDAMAVIKRSHMSEEVEQLEEGTPTKKQVKQAIGIARDKRYAKGNVSGAVKAMDKVNKGLAQHPAVSKELKKQNENFNFKDLRHQLDELSPKTLGSYAQKSVRDLEKRDRAMGKATQRDRTVVDPEKSKPFQKMAKRRSGLAKAINRLSKEGFELTEAYKLKKAYSDDETEAHDVHYKPKNGKKQIVGYIVRHKYSGRGAPIDPEKQKHTVYHGSDGENFKHETVVKGRKAAMAVVQRSHAKSALGEEIEQLDELSPKTLGSYAKKAQRQTMNTNMAIGANSTDNEATRREKAFVKKRKEGASRAIGKLVQKKLSKEDVEQIDELKSKTLKSYISKANKDLSKRVADYHSKDIASSPSKIYKRDLAIDKAKGRLSMNRQLGRAEESVQINEFEMKTTPKGIKHHYELGKKQAAAGKEMGEVSDNYGPYGIHFERGYRDHQDAMAKKKKVNEAKMTDAQMDKREKIVMAMKPKMQGFKDRYGDDAKSVMYATATKQAMKD